MTYELFEKAKELYEEINHYNSVLSLFSTSSKLDDNTCKKVILQRFNSPCTEKISISDELAYTLYDAVRTKKEELELEFAELGEDS